MDNIWGGDLADMQLLCRYNIRMRFLLCIIDAFNRKVKRIYLIKDRKLKQQLKYFTNLQKIPTVNQTKYRQIKVVNQTKAL